MQLMKKNNAEEILDASVNQTLSRTLMTAGTTLVAVLALVLFGGEVISGFASTMLIGIVFGTYSSVFQSCAWLKIFEGAFLGEKKDDALAFWPDIIYIIFRINRGRLNNVW
jgi:preprotein translocase subunit SecF